MDGDFGGGLGGRGLWGAEVLESVVIQVGQLLGACGDNPLRRLSILCLF